jgi:hypothetical protein
VEIVLTGNSSWMPCDPQGVKGPDDDGDDDDEYNYNNIYIVDKDK